MAPERSHPTSEAKGGIRGQGGGRKEQPHAQGVVAARVQEGLEEPSHIKGQEGWWEEIPLIQGRSSGCALLEQL